MNAINTKVFKSGNGAAVRLPPDFGFDVGAEVVVERNGNRVTIRPRHRKSRSEMLKKLRELPAPDEIQKRDPFEAPERPGL